MSDKFFKILGGGLFICFGVSIILKGGWYHGGYLAKLDELSIPLGLIWIGIGLYFTLSNIKKEAKMKEYKSNEEFFQAFQELIKRLDDGGNHHAAHELRQGFSCLNGLTDGWALLMESIEKTISQYRGNLRETDLKELQSMLEGVKKAVYRK